MKVRVRKTSLWAVKVRKTETDTLQRLCRQHAHGRLQHMSTDALFVVLEELVRRREASGQPFRSNEEALADFRRHYMPLEPYDPTIPPELTPSPEGGECLGNGQWPGYECCCDECDHYLVCFTDVNQ